MKYDKENVFAKIIRGEIPSKKIYEDDKVLAFYDLYPICPIHCIVIPKGEYVDYADFVQNAGAEEISNYFTKINEIAKGLSLSTDGFRLCTNRGALSGQTIFHFHTHILAGAKLSNPC
ncbi:MAG: HIT domain-containing protein [Pseudomonadota bacterium]